MSSTRGSVKPAWVIDTVILQKANAPIIKKPRANSEFARRVSLLEKLARGTAFILYSPALLHEYGEHIKEPRNEFVKLFLELLASSKHAARNWHSPWSGGERARARGCRYPSHDDHLLRTAIRLAEGTTIYSEDRPLLRTNQCIYRTFRVRISSI